MRTKPIILVFRKYYRFRSTLIETPTQLDLQRVKSFWAKREWNLVDEIEVQV